MNPWRTRFQQQADKLVQNFTVSTSFDQRLYRQDIAGSIAHARMLANQGIILDKDAELIIMGLVSIRQEIERGEFEFKVELEDVHMNIEHRLSEKIGETAGKLHTGRSRNDQVSLDLRMYTKDAIANTIERLRILQGVLVGLAEANKEVIIPGYTHLQRAQPVLFAHHFLAYYEMFQRDVDRFRGCLKRTDVMPLGSGALAGVPYPTDRAFLAEQLSFSAISQNSLDAVSDRDFVIEYQSAASITMMHLSRLAEEMILWSTHEFAFIEIDDAFTTGSSLMPQKKNPDVAELARGKTGRVYGNLIGVLTMMKALPLSYNRDMQEDKEGLFDTVDTLSSTLEVFAGMVASVRVDAEHTRKATEKGYLLATDLADYLVAKGLPFRKAYTVVGSLVSYAVEHDKTLQQLELKEYQKFSKLFKEDVFAVSEESSIAARNIVGGTALEQVEAQLKRAKDILVE